MIIFATRFLKLSFLKSLQISEFVLYYATVSEKLFMSPFAGLHLLQKEADSRICVIAGQKIYPV